MKINQLDLFSGIGGFHLGFERAGYEVTSYFSEVDKHAIAVYKHQFPNSTYVGSVTDVRGADLPNIDLITFGSPCQDFSLAGKRKGMEGDRSSLVLEAIRLIGECRPRVFVWENVKGTFSSNNGEDFAAILQAFANIGGYRLEWQLLNTSWFLPQNRERIYLVGYSTTTKRGWRGVFPIGEASQSNSELGCTGEAVTKCLTARGQEGHAGMQLIKVIEPNYGSKALNETIERNTLNEGEPKALDLYNREARYESPTLTEPHHNSLRLFDGYRIRRLTPIECERLQGFPDDHTAYGNYDGEVKPMSNTQRYKQCGNAVTVDVVAAVAKNCLPLFK
jgi:DNA (cytosine-5)-methyltransferase 1